MARDYFTQMDHAGLLRDFPVGLGFPAAYRGLSRDALRARQERDLARMLDFAFRVPFYRRLYARAGAERGDIRTLEDLAKLPSYDKADLMDSVARFPPLGDFHGQEAHPPQTRPQIIFQTTSGTTVMRNALSQSPPTASTGCTAPARPGSSSAANAAPPPRPRASAMSTRTLRDRSIRDSCLPCDPGAPGPARQSPPRSGGRRDPAR